MWALVFYDWNCKGTRLSCFKLNCNNISISFLTNCTFKILRFQWVWLSSSNRKKVSTTWQRIGEIIESLWNRWHCLCQCWWSSGWGMFHPYGNRLWDLYASHFLLIIKGQNIILEKHWQELWSDPSNWWIVDQRRSNWDDWCPVGVLLLM
jgi:hypothetical protein